MGIILPVRKHILPLIIVLAVSLLGLKALFHPGLFTAHDIWHQVARLYHYQQAVSQGAFPPYWIATLAGGFGYPLFVFSYHLPWLLALPILKAGFDVPTTIKILFFLSYALSGFAMYALSLKLFKSVWAGVLSAFLYLWAPYRFLTIFVSAQMGVAFVYTFIPILFLGIFMAAEEKRKKLAIAAIAAGVSGIVLSHFSSVIAVVPATAIFALAILFETKDKKLFLINSLKGTLLGIGLSSFYLLPAFYYSRLGVLGFGSYYQRHFVNLSQLVYSKWGYGPITNNAKDGELSFQVGIAQWASLVLSSFLIIVSKIKRPQKYIPASLILGFVISIFMMLDWSLPVWKLIVKVIEVDFPFRFMLPAVFTSSLLAGFLISNVKRFIKPVLLVVLILVALFTNRNHIRVNLYTNFSVKDYVDAEFTTSSMNEYLPPWVNPAIFKTKINSPLEPESVPVANLEKTSQKIFFEAEVPKDMEVTLNHFRYPGINLYLDGQKKEYSNDNYGRITTTLTRGNHKIAVQFEDTPAIKAGKNISLVSLVIFLLLLL